jgi:hypothetical protein
LFLTRALVRRTDAADQRFIFALLNRFSFCRARGIYAPDEPTLAG